MLTAKISGIPFPDVTWLRDGKPLEESKNLTFKREGEIFTFTYENISQADDGTYTIQAKNAGGAVEVTAKVTILQAPSVQKQLSDIDVIEGESARFKIPLSGIPLPSVSWFKDSVELKDNDNLKMVIKESIAYLEINKAILKDIGDYTVTLKNTSGEVSSSAMLNVLSPPTISDIADQTVIAGNQLELHCKVTGVPVPSISWFKNDKRIPENEKTQFEEKDGLIILRKKEITVDDEGKYVLKVENKAGKTEKSANIIIQEPPTFDETNLLLKDQVLLENDDLHLKVTALGKPAPNLQWRKDDVELKPDKRTKITKDKDQFSLLIKKVEPADSGKYQCYSQNEAGEKIIEAAVVVNSKPQVLKKLKDVIVSEGETLSLDAQFKGYPEPEVTWYRDDNPLPIENTKKEETTHSFQIDKLTLDNSGTYSAVAKNSVGECKTTAKVKVIKAPYFVKALTDITLVEKQQLKLEAEIHGFPQPEVDWAKDGKILSGKKGGPEKLAFKRDGNKYSLSMSKVTTDDQGVYSLTAKNQAGEINGQATVVVHGNY